MKPAVFLLDLDGIIVANQAFEENVTTHIVSMLAASRQIEVELARSLWEHDLESTKFAPNWHDYEMHCRSFNLADAWMTAHEASRDSLALTPGVSIALDAFSRLGVCWIVSDATDWVIDFKLRCVGIGRLLFDRVFSLTRCGTSKKFKAYWMEVQACLQHEYRNHTYIYIDNRYDLLTIASRVINPLHTICIPAPEHSQIDRLWPQSRRIAAGATHFTSMQNLNDTVNQILTTG